MHKIDKINNYYNSLERKIGLVDSSTSGVDYALLGWESRDAQILRFDAMIDNVDLHNTKLLDVGCGLANLLEYLNSLGISLDYTGVDILPEMIERTKLKNLNGRFFAADIFTDRVFNKDEFDISYCSGIFNLDLGNNEKFLKTALEYLLLISSRAVIFNMLHKKSPSKEHGYFYYCPDKVVKIVESNFNFVKVIKIVENYLKNDFTVVLSK